MCTWPISRAIRERTLVRMTKSSRQRGMSLVELMVAIVIGMLTVLSITQTLTFFDGQRRGTTTGADAQSNGALATYLIEREVRMAGYGVYANDQRFVDSCSGGGVRAYNNGRDILFSPENVPFAPVVINPPGIPGGDANTDVIGVAYSSSAIGITGKGVKIEAATATGYSVENAAGFVTGDLMLAVPAGAGSDCSIYEVTDGPGTVSCSGASAVKELQHGEGAYESHYHSCAQVSSTQNKPGGLGVTPISVYNIGNLFNLGRRDGLMFAYYAVRGGQLTRCNHMQSDCSADGNKANPAVWEPQASDIVMLRAEFGIASGGLLAGLDTWRSTLCADVGCIPSFADWGGLRVMRIAVVARSQQAANAASTAPAWGGQSAIVLGTGSDKYRYSTTEVVVPLRNIVWGASS